MKLSKLITFIVILLSSFTIFANSNSESGVSKSATGNAVIADEKAMSMETRPDFSSPQIVDNDLVVDGLPEEVVWYTSKPGVFGSSRAKQGGTLTQPLSEFPQTFRVVGPNANGGTRAYFLDSASLVATNKETKEWMPQLATDWAYSADKKTVYFKLNENATWTDGEKVTSSDYVFMLKMMRDKNIQAPWYNDFYTSEILDVTAYGDYVISVTGSTERAPDDLLYNVTIAPKPEHFYNGIIPEDYVDRYQWEFEPTTGPYTLDSFVKGENLSFKKVSNWWGYEYDYNKFRYNIDTINFKVITGGRDIQKEYFFNGELDTYGLIIPKDWADSADNDFVKKGYIDRQYSFYVPLTGLYGIMLNTEAGIFTNQDVRTGLYYAINMDKMIATVLRGEYNRYHNIGLAHVFAGISFDDDSIRVPDFDPKMAAELFSKAGYTEIGNDGIRTTKDGKKLSFELMYPSPSHTERLSVLKEEAKKCGLEIVLNNQTEGAFTILLDKKHEAFFLGMSTSDIPAPWEYFHSDNAKAQTNNFFMIKNAELDVLIEDYRAESDLVKKAEINKKIQKKVHELALIIPSYTVPYTRGASWKWVRFPSWLNQKYSDTFLDPLYDVMVGYTGYNWIDEDIKKEVIQARMKSESFETKTYIDDTNKQ